MRVQRGFFNDSSVWIEEGRSRGCSKSSSETILATSLQLCTQTHSHTPGPYNVGGWLEHTVGPRNTWLWPKAFPRAVAPWLACCLRYFEREVCVYQADGWQTVRNRTLDCTILHQLIDQSQALLTAFQSATSCSLGFPQYLSTNCPQEGTKRPRSKSHYLLICPVPTTEPGPQFSIKIC